MTDISLDRSSGHADHLTSYAALMFSLKANSYHP
jgi:hypothetical protein